MKFVAHREQGRGAERFLLEALQLQVPHHPFWWYDRRSLALDPQLGLREVQRRRTISLLYLKHQQRRTRGVAGPQLWSPEVAARCMLGLRLLLLLLLLLLLRQLRLAPNNFIGWQQLHMRPLQYVVDLSVGLSLLALAAANEGRLSHGGISCGCSGAYSLALACSGVLLLLLCGQR